MRQGQENKKIKEVGKTSTILLDSCRKLFRVVRSSLTNPRIQRAVIHPTRNQPLVKLPKTKASTRTIPLADKLIEDLSPFESEGFILGGEKPLTYQQKKRSFDKIRERMGLEAYSAHDFRHTCATEWKEHGMTL